MTDAQTEILQKLEEIEGLLSEIRQRPASQLNAAEAGLVTRSDLPFDALLAAHTSGHRGGRARYAARPTLPTDRRIEKELRHRKELCELFGADLVADPVWTMILELLLANSQNKRVSVMSLCIASGIAQTTALRWIGVMEQKGIVQRQPDRVDRRRIYVELTQGALANVASFLDRHS